MSSLYTRQYAQRYKEKALVALDRHTGVEKIR